eukprot:COSAG04_NODE_10994_length_738_cov_1.619718_2_plen_122_part_01
MSARCFTRSCGVGGETAVVTAPLPGATFGARLDGLDLAAPLEPAQAGSLMRALRQHKVLHVPAQQRLTPHGLELLGNWLGAPVGSLTINGVTTGPALPQVLTNQDGSANTAAGWHSDLNYER